MSAGLVLGLLSSGGDGYQAPTTEAFYVPLFTVGPVTVTRPMVLIAVAAAITLGYLLWASKNASARPTKRQWLLEKLYDFVRVDIAKDMIGAKHHMRFVPLLFTAFVFIAVCNLMGSAPFSNFPPMSRIGMPMALVLVVFVVYHWAGIQKHGLVGYFASLMPPGVPGWLAPVIYLLELVTYFITRPLTLCLRLFGNMLAGHMLMGVFLLGGWYLLSSGNAGLMAAGVGAYGMGFLMQGLEFLVQLVQAYVFAMLAASYFGTAVADEH